MATPLATTPAEVWQRLKSLYPDNTWFGGIHLEENKPRLLKMLADVVSWHPPGSQARVVDVGCFNGFLCYAFGQFGHSTAGIDALPEEKVPERTRILQMVNAPFHFANFNQLDPFRGFHEPPFDVAILGEVIEHILNHPTGFLRAIAGLLRPGGRLILTTPNPLTLANAFRVFRGQSTCWGDHEFATMPKIQQDGSIISFEGIHYREYARQTLVEMAEEAGFALERHEYLSMGASHTQSSFKRSIKALPLWSKLSSHRLFGMTHYMVVRRH